MGESIGIRATASIEHRPARTIGVIIAIASGLLACHQNESRETDQPDATASDADPPDAAPDAAVPLTERSGTRLRLTWIASGDHRVRQGVHDNSLGLDCAFELTADGRWRCLPAYPAVAKSENTEYLDAACSKPLYRHYTGCTGNDPAPARVRFYGDACAARVLPRGDLVQTSFVYRFEGGTCKKFEAGTGTLLYALGDPVGLDEFVGAAPELLGAGRVAAAYFRGDDGSIVHQGQRDTALDTECQFGRAPAMDSCIPAESVIADRWYSSSSCDAELAQVSTAARKTCASKFALVSDVCEAPELHRLGDPVAKADHWDRNYFTNQCEFDLLQWQGVQQLGDAVTVASAASTVEGDGPVRQVVYDVAGVHAPGALIDGVRDVPCTPIVASDGVLRCMASTVNIHVYGFYTDDKCKDLVLIAKRYPARAAAACEAAPRYGIETSSSHCSEYVEEYHLGAKRTLAGLWSGPLTGCSPAQEDPRAEYYTVEGKEEPTTLPAITYIID
jgi:hypothetical protein